MGHSIPVGSLAITHPVSAGGIRDGDVILVHEQVDGVQARPKMHRVIRIEHDGGSIIVSTKGDANPAPDPSLYVLPARVDVVAFSLPFLGYLVSFLLTPAGWLLVVGLPGALACAFVLRRIWSGGDPARPVDLPATGLTLLGGSTAAGDVEHESRKLRGATGPVHAAIPLSLRPSLMMTAVVLLAITTSAGAAAGYLMASRSTTSDGAGRLTQEALSLTQHSAHLATGDAYAADLLLLRDAEDPALGAPGRPERDAALARLLAGPSNVFDTLAVIDPAGHVIASTDPTLVDVQGSAAVRQARANAGVASSVDESADGSLGTIDFAAPLRAPNGAPSGVLFAHVTAAHLWAPTLQATVDGSRNVIVDAHGVLVAGPANELGHPWNAAPAPMGGLRASVDGSASVCGSSTIGEGTPLDMGLRVASCLPNSLGTAEGHTSARRELGGIAFVAAVVVAVVLFASIVYVVARQQPGRAPRRNTPTGLGALAARLDAIEARLEARDA
jgi:signal peptidase I